MHTNSLRRAGRKGGTNRYRKTNNTGANIIAIGPVATREVS